MYEQCTPTKYVSITSHFRRQYHLILLQSATSKMTLHCKPEQFLIYLIVSLILIILATETPSSFSLCDTLAVHKTFHFSFFAIEIIFPVQSPL